MESLEKKSIKWLWLNCKWWNVIAYDKKHVTIEFQFGQNTVIREISKNYWWNLKA